MLPFHSLKMAQKGLLYRARKHAMPVFVSFARSNEYLILEKIDVFDSQSTTFHQSQSSAVKQH